LHAMADKIGVSRRWYQGDHYDIASSKRALAVHYGATEITMRQCAMMCGNRRATGGLGDPATAETVWKARRTKPIMLVGS